MSQPRDPYGANPAASLARSAQSPTIKVAVDGKHCISADPQIMHGAVCPRGTRIPVSIVLNNLAAGESTATILDACPILKAEHMPAAIGYGADRVREPCVSVPA